MGTFATKKILPGNPSLIPAIAEQIRTEFMAEQFEVQIDNLLSGGVDISISKGNLFKAVLGLKSALKVSLIPKDNAIAFEAGIGIFGQQAIPTIISMLFFWPVLITQIWGMVHAPASNGAMPDGSSHGLPNVGNSVLSYAGEKKN